MVANSTATMWPSLRVWAFSVDPRRVAAWKLDSSGCKVAMVLRAIMIASSRPSAGVSVMRVGMRSVSGAPLELGVNSGQRLPIVGLWRN